MPTQETPDARVNRMALSMPMQVSAQVAEQVRALAATGGLSPFACKNSVAASAVDGLGMGVGFTAALLLMGAVRELLGTGAIAGLQIIPASVSPILIFILPPGGFFVFGILMACANKLADKKGLSKAELKGCEACPMAASCSLRGEVENKKDGKEAAGK